MKNILNIIMFLTGWVVFAQPTGSCTTGITQIGTDRRFYGCVEGNWKLLSEEVAELATDTPPLPTPYSTQLDGNIKTGVTVNEIGNLYSEDFTFIRKLKNEGFTPIAVPDAPTHTVGKIFYSQQNKHFYEGVENGLWHQIDNSDSSYYCGQYPGGKSFLVNTDMGRAKFSCVRDKQGNTYWHGVASFIDSQVFFAKLRPDFPMNIGEVNPKVRVSFVHLQGPYYGAFDTYITEVVSAYN